MECNYKFKFVNLPFERGEILFSKGFSIYTDIRKLQDKAKTSYTLNTRRLRFGYEQQFSRSTYEKVICADRLHKLQDKSSLNKKAFMAVDDKYTLVQIAKSEN